MGRLESYGKVGVGDWSGVGGVRVGVGRDGIGFEGFQVLGSGGLGLGELVGIRGLGSKELE